MTPVLRKRIISGVTLALAGVGTLYLPAWSVALLLPVIVLPTQLEFYKFLDQAGIPAFRTIGLSAGVLLVLSVWLAFITGGGVTAAAEWPAVALFLTVLALCVRQLPRKNDAQSFITMACTLLGIMYVPFLFGYFLKLAYTWETPAWNMAAGASGRLIFVYLLAVVKLTDVGAYFVGTRFGRHKLLPRISPGKTVEGLLGGLLTGLLASIVCWAIWGGRMGEVSLTLGGAILLGILLPVTGGFGDLVESMFKRSAGAKDSSACFPGLGGMLDVLDSLLFAAPVLYIYLRLAG